MELVDAADPGLIVLTVHRLVTGVSDEAFSQLVDELKEDFDILPFPPESLMTLAPERELWLGISFGQAAFLLIPHREDPLPPTSLHLLHDIILPRIAQRAPGCRVEYFTEVDTLLNLAAAKVGIAFIVPPLRPEELLRLSQLGVRLPGKATYFYPKLPTGLVFYRPG
jgi:uncharacterized protein (DUF1015 family)